ncbi:protein Star-like [Mercenaria mercenaria]|uniref:protein Star-like n=1 Tax=Mercenaria mercenaria TaxID=6596 RepID=UPI001E1D5DD3|nr:protein Star-like [Mercenaria mercenaria]
MISEKSLILISRKMGVKKELLWFLIILVVAVLAVRISRRTHLPKETSQLENIYHKDRKESVQLENINYIDIMSKLNRDKIAFNDRTLISTVKKYYVQPPSMLPYNLSDPEIQNPSPGQTQFIDEYLNQKRNGFYVDCGAFDGEHLSNSLFLERYRNWTGILIEPNPTTYGLLRQKHRKAYSLNACLSTNKYPSLETFSTGKIHVLGKVLDDRYKMKKRAKNLIQVQCFPLYTILLAIGKMDIDYFSLDVEGAESGVLHTIPWDKLNIKMFSIEHNKWVGGKQHLKRYMDTKGYDFVKEIRVNVAPDFIFVRRKL